jgi:hypothetical protein
MTKFIHQQNKFVVLKGDLPAGFALNTSPEYLFAFQFPNRPSISELNC